ncbi:MAG: ribonuclease III [Hornefia sp.]|nr:ribonuclease III [Hornefia sp.]
MTINSEGFEKKIKYRFIDKGLLKIALTHSSYCRENKLSSVNCNERLEFIGDGYLDAVVGTYLFKRLANLQEGKLSKIRSKVVCEKSLAKVGEKLGIGEYLFLGKGEEKSGGRKRMSIVADATEAVIGAIFLDGGYEEAERFILREFGDIIHDVLTGKFEKDYKSLVQEKLQKDGSVPVICYRIDKETGPDHNKTFYVHLECNGKKLGKGSGHSKKEAEQNAACDALNGGYI